VKVPWRKCVTLGGAGVLLGWLTVNPQNPTRDIIRALRARRMYLIDLRNHGYQVAFPQESGGRVAYKNPKSEYLYSVIAPSGRSFFGFTRTFYGGAPPTDALVRRVLGESVGPEENIATPLSNFFQFAVSPDETLMLIGGRLKNAPKGQADGLFLLNMKGAGIEFVAPYPRGGMNEDIRSLSLSDGAKIVLYEDGGSILKYTRSPAGLALADRHSGHFPALMPEGASYLYADHGWLMLSNGREKRELIAAPTVVGAIRISPDGGFVAFGAGSSEYSHLRVCELDTKECVDGPAYTEWIAGRETFWIRQ
jgi:hypothetical protein